MRRTIFAAAALALGFAATAAYAQADNPPSPPKPPAANGPAATPPPPPHHPGDEAMRGHEGMGGPDEMHGPGGRGPWMKHRMMMMMSKGAHIRVSDGDIHVNVKCAEDDSTAECGQTVIKILREMQSSDQNLGYEDRNDEDSGHGGNGGDGNPTMNE